MATATTRRFALEVDRHGTFLRLGRTEVYARRDRTGPRSWGVFRDPPAGALEVDAGRFRLTVSRAPLPLAGSI